MGRYSITDGQLQQLRSTGMSWSAISETLGVDRTTIYRRQRLFGKNIDEAYRFSDIPDGDLDTILTHLLHHSRNAGETYVQGSLRARGGKNTEMEITGKAAGKVILNHSWLWIFFLHHLYMCLYIGLGLGLWWGLWLNCTLAYLYDIWHHLLYNF